MDGIEPFLTGAQGRYAIAATYHRFRGPFDFLKGAE
jgi:hypothetical protein